MLFGMIELFILLLGALHAALRSRADLVAENLLLRHQLVVPARPNCKRAPLRARDKLPWLVVRRWWADWRGPLVIVRPRRSSAGTTEAGACCGAGNPAPTLVGPGSARRSGS